MNFDNILVIIPARGGSKGLPRKNIKLLNGKPLLLYSVEIARSIFKDKNICVSTDDLEIKNLVESIGLKVPFIRPNHLATDFAKTEDVIKHALEYYKLNFNLEYDKVLLLQPTSPLRTKKHILDALDLYRPDIDMVVSVKETKSNPYYTLFEMTDEGYLKKSKDGLYTRRQDCPIVYEFNGSIYVMNYESIYNKGIGQFSKIIPYEMSDKYSVDIDDELDWLMVEIILSTYNLNE